MKNFKPKQNYSVVKHNDLIEARYKLTLHEQKLVVIVASMVKPNDVDFHEYRISVKEFREMMDVKGHNYHTQIRQKSKMLLKKPLAIPHEHGELYCNWFSSINYLDGEGQIVFKFDPELKPYMIGLKRKFTEYKSRNIMQLHSGYSIRIYELLKQYLSIGERVLELDNLKTLLGIDGKYKAYGHFKQRILDPAKDELNAGTDIMFKYEPIKTGRKVTAIRFIIWLNPDYQEPENPVMQAFIDSLTNYGVTMSAIDAAVKKHGIDGAIEIRDHAILKLTSGKVNDPAAYLASCLRDGHGAKSQEQREQERQEAERKRIAKRKVEIKDHLEQIEMEFERHKRDLLSTAKADLTPTELERYEQTYQAEIRDGKQGPYLTTIFKTHGKRASGYRATFDFFLTAHLISPGDITEFDPAYRELKTELVGLET